MSENLRIKCKCCNHLSSLRDIYESNYRCWNCESEIELIQECDAKDKFGREVEQLKVEMDGFQERAEMLLKAKDEWADRARAAEAERDALRDEVEMLRKDAARLDFLIIEAATINEHVTKTGQRFSLFWPWRREEQAEQFDDARQAIDACMAKEGGDQ